MGIADRDYYRNPPRERSGGFFSQLTPVVKGLLIANLAIYFLDLLLGNVLRNFGAFTIQSAVFQGRIWEFISFQFLHGSVGHVFFNCMGIFFFGSWLERWWGAKKFLSYYLLCGVAGAVFFTLLVVLGLLPGDNLWTPLVGASAGIYGILIGVAVIAPNLRVALLFPPIELSMRQLAIALMAISVGAILFKLGGNEGGEAGHLGGAILGFILMRFPQLLGRPTGTQILSPRTATPLSVAKSQAAAVDAILDKISRDGFQSLSPQERDFLQQASTHSKSSS